MMTTYWYIAISWYKLVYNSYGLSICSVIVLTAPYGKFVRKLMLIRHKRLIWKKKYYEDAATEFKNIP